MRSILVLTILPLLLLFSSCSGFKPVSDTASVDDNDGYEEVDTGPAICEYTLIVHSPLWLYGPDGMGKTRYEDIPEGDTIIVTDRKIQSATLAIYKGTAVWVAGATSCEILNWRVLSWYEKAAYKPAEVKDYNGKFKPMTIGSVEKPTTSNFKAASKLASETIATEKATIPHESSSYTKTYPHSSTTLRPNSASSSTIYTGPRGGRYYINSNGNKTYLKNGSTTGSGYSRSRKSSSSYRSSRRR